MSTTLAGRSRSARREPGPAEEAEEPPPADGALPGAIAPVRTGDRIGDYVIEDVPAGPQTVRVQLIGYGSVDRQVTVGATPVTVNFELSEQAFALAGECYRDYIEKHEHDPAPARRASAAQRTDRTISGLRRHGRVQRRQRTFPPELP